MSRKPPHRWLLKVTLRAKAKLDTLTGSERQGVFRRLRDLLNAEIPYGLTFVEMLKEKQFDRVYKFRVGNYRVFFVIKSGEVIDQKHKYKGTLYVLDIQDRKEAYS
jgi:mRNA-degrading endonuclease RelE of RelBE toxin-antitoxin system